MENAKNKITDHWNRESDSYFSKLHEHRAIDKVVADPQSAFHPVTWDVIRSTVPELKGKKICVPSSGDNLAVFAFALMGASVTSCDISQQQLANAKGIAGKLGLSIEFMVADTMKLDGVEPDAFDLVYTSEGVHVWIDDLDAMYRNVARILKPQGAYIMYDIHPFGRPFKDGYGVVEIRKPYDAVGPHNGGMNYHWRMQDLVNAVASAGLRLSRLEEMADVKENGHFWFYDDERVKMTRDVIDEYYDWRTNPLAALPQWVTLVALKR